jgi:hypothetical protein
VPFLNDKKMEGTNFFLLVLPSLCRLNFTCGDIKGNCLRGHFYRVEVVLIIFPLEGGFFAEEIFHGGVFHGINFPEGIYYGSNFLLVGGVFAGSLLRGGGDFWNDLKQFLQMKVFSK